VDVLSSLFTPNSITLYCFNCGLAIEGVQPQTEVVIKQAWLEGLKPVLVLNKVDRLIIEKKLSTQEAHLALVQVLEAVNAVIGNLFAADVMKENEDNLESGLDDADDSELYFSPERGNVVFGSAYDSWAFDIGTFASIYSAKLGFRYVYIYLFKFALLHMISMYFLMDMFSMYCIGEKLIFFFGPLFL